jgi:hypothetical protein
VAGFLHVVFFLISYPFVMKKLFSVTIALHAALGGFVQIQAGTPNAAQHELRLSCHDGYLPDLPMLVRVELQRKDGSFAQDVWDAEATLSVDEPGVVLSTNRIFLHNGMGSGLITFKGGGDFRLAVSVGPLEASRSLRTLTNVPVTPVSGTLAGTETTWSNLVNITSDVMVPANHTLTIEPGTLVLINGVSSGTSAADIVVNGAIRSLGTAERPVTITCISSNLSMRWGQIRHTGARPSIYQHTSISRGGRAQGEGHTSSFGGPLIRPNNSAITFESCNLTDHGGKIMHSTGSDLVFNNCLLARAIMGPEVIGTGVLCTNTYFMEMASNDDGDGIYLQGSNGKPLWMTGCVLAGLTGRTDDGIDTLNANATFENCILRDWNNPGDDPKGISVFNGTTYIRRCLIQDCFIGVSAKSSESAPTLVFMEQCTVGGIANAVAAAWKSNATNGVIDFRITNSILRSADGVRTDFGATNFTIGYCNISESWPGAGNSTEDPLFVDEPAHDYRLRPYSPCIDAGSPGSPVDPDQSPADVGCLTFVPPPPQLSSSERQLSSAFSFLLDAYTNRQYRIEVSTNCVDWSLFTEVMLTNSPAAVIDSTEAQSKRFYRARWGL